MSLPTEIINKILLWNIHPCAERMKQLIGMYKFMYGTGTYLGKNTDVVEKIIRMDRYEMRNKKPYFCRYMIIDTFVIKRNCFYNCVLNLHVLMKKHASGPCY